MDNFSTEKIFNDFNAQMVKSLESILFIDFRNDLALFQCPAGQDVKAALQVLIAMTSTQRMYFIEI